MRNIAIALALALVAGLLVVFYTTSYKRSVVEAESDVTVWVAARDVPEGTPGEAVASNGLRELQVAKKSVAPGAITEPEQLEGRIASGPIYAGEQITTLRFTTEEKQGIRSQLTGNKRAIQVTGTQHQLLAGTLREGDFVDVVGSWNVPESDSRHFSRIVLREILVLKAAERPNSTTKLTSGPNGSGLSVMLALTDAQSQKLFWLTQNGEWSLELRPADDAQNSPESAETAWSLLLDGFSMEQLQSLANAERVLTGKE